MTSIEYHGMNASKFNFVRSHVHMIERSNSNVSNFAFTIYHCSARTCDAVRYTEFKSKLGNNNKDQTNFFFIRIFLSFVSVFFACTRVYTSLNSLQSELPIPNGTQHSCIYLYYSRSLASASIHLFCRFYLFFCLSTVINYATYTSCLSLNDLNTRSICNTSEFNMNWKRTNNAPEKIKQKQCRHLLRWRIVVLAVALTLAQHKQ